MSANTRLGRFDLMRYAALALPLAFAGMPLYVNAPDFYATQLKIPLATLGAVLLILRFIDAVQDPFIGYVSDRFAQYRAAIMLIAVFLLGASFWLLFQPWQGAGVLWFAASMFLATTSFSILTINLGALSGLWSELSAERMRIAGFREAMTLVGLLAAVLLPALLQRVFLPVEAFFYVCLFLAGCLVLAAFMFAAWMRKFHACFEVVPETAKQPMRLSQLFPAFTPALCRFFVVYGLSSLASSLPAVLVLFFIRDGLGAAAYTGLFLLLYFMSGILCMPLWIAVSRRIGKAYAWLGSMLLALVGFVAAYQLGAGDVVAYAIICAVTGMAFGAELALPSAMLADFIEGDGARGVASRYFGMLAFFNKAAFALAAAIAFPWLEANGFHAAAENTPEALSVLRITYALLPCGIKALAAAALVYFIVMTTKGDKHAKGRTFTHTDGDTHVAT